MLGRLKTAKSKIFIREKSFRRKIVLGKSSETCRNWVKTEFLAEFTRKKIKIGFSQNLEFLFRLNFYQTSSLWSSIFENFFSEIKWYVFEKTAKTTFLDLAVFTRLNMPYNGLVHKGTGQTVSASVLEPWHWIGNSTILSWNTSFPVVCDNRKYLKYVYRPTRKMAYNGLVHKGTDQTVSASVLKPWHWIGNSTILSWNTSFPVSWENRK